MENSINEEMLSKLTFDEFFEILKIKGESYSIGDCIAVYNCLKKRTDLSDDQKQALQGLTPPTYGIDLYFTNPKNIPPHEAIKLNFNKALLEHNLELRDLVAKNINNPEFILEQDKRPIISLTGAGKFSDLVKIVKKQLEPSIVQQAKENVEYKKSIDKGKKVVFENLKGKFYARRHNSINDNFVELELSNIDKVLKGERPDHHIFDMLGIKEEKSIITFNELCKKLFLGITPDYESNYTNLCKIYGLVDYKEWLKKISNQEMRIFIDNIDTFSNVTNYGPQSVALHLKKNGYFDVSENFIQQSLEEIMKESFHKVDWGGESNDLYTTNLKINGQRVATAFLLKGNGLDVKTMEIRHCGKNGNQILSLVKSPAELFIIQFVGNISESVIEDIRDKVELLRLKGKKAWYCIINGQDTARILKAYDKI